jgi:hypothetical protein
MMEDAMAQRKQPTTESAISQTRANAAGIDSGRLYNSLLEQTIEKAGKISQGSWLDTTFC